MLRPWHSRLRACLDSDGATVWLLRRQPNGRQTIIHTGVVKSQPAPADVGEVIDALSLALSEASEGGHPVTGLRCDVVIADTWMLYDVLEANVDDTPRRAADDLVSAALADTAGIKTGELVTRWQRQGVDRSFACALPVSVLRKLQVTLQHHKVRLGSLNGELVCAFNANRHGLSSGRSVLAVARPGGTQLGVVVDGGFAALRFEPGVRDATVLLERSHALMRCAGFGPDPATRYFADDTLPVSDAVPWLGRTPPQQPWLRRLMSRSDAARLDLDLSPTRPRVPLANWLLLIAGALAAAFAALQLQAARAERGREARELRTLEASLSEPAAGSASAKVQDARSARAAATALRELQVPWAALFVALESVAGRNVALLSVEPSPQRQEVRITAEAKNSAAMLDFLDALHAQSLREVALVSHQVQAQAPGAPLRFQARAQWMTP